MDSQKKYRPTFSCEFFPPKTDKGRANLPGVIDELAAIRPAYFSCTYGAVGSTQDGTLDVVRLIQDKGFEAAPHITCIGSTADKIQGLLQQYQDLGIKRIVALRGDLPEGMNDPGEFHYANELVEFIRTETGDRFHIEVAAYPEKHPEAVDITADLEHFKRKVNAGANAAITQYFFDLASYTCFVDACEQLGIATPIVPGIMPITNYKQLAAFSDRCGAIIPPPLREKLAGFGDDLASLRAYGLDIVSELCRKLLDTGAPGLHFYTLNRAAPTVALWERLGPAD